MIFTAVKHEKNDKYCLGGHRESNPPYIALQLIIQGNYKNFVTLDPYSDEYIGKEKNVRLEKI